MSEKIKIVLADDHPIMRQGLRQVLERESDLIIAAECGDGITAITEIEQRRPDIAVLDVDMPRASGFDVLRYLSDKQNTTKIILLTVHDEAEFFNEALRLGVSAYVLKDSATEELLNAVRAVAGGQNFISQKLNRHLLRNSNKKDVGGLINLTAMEKQILKLIADYKTSKEIGDKLCISPLTVKTHRRNISLKLNIEGNNALIKFAIENKNLL